MRALVLGLAVASTLVPFAAPARAAGLYFSDRGVRPLGRAGAFVAGADDLGAMAYNPAGLYDAGTQLMLDASWLNFSSEYQRQAIVRQVDPNTGGEVARYRRTFPRVEGSSPAVPLPTLGVSLRVHEQWVVAVGAWAPSAAVAAYPERVDGQPGPQRYSLLNLNGSALGVLGAWVAWAPTKNLRLGAGFEALVGTYHSAIVLSGCVPDRFLCAPEQPDWDVLTQVKVGPIFAPSGNFGAIWAPHPKWRVGAAFQLPFWIRSSGDVETRMPSAAAFARAHQSGTEAEVAFDLPWSLKLGVETRIVEDLRVELGFAYDGWSMHDKIAVRPRGVSLDNVAAFPARYVVPAMDMPRNFQDSGSVRLGAEYAFKLLGAAFDGRGGLSWESSAVPPEHMTVLTIDAPKVTAAIGLSLHLGKLRLDVTYAHVFASDVTVDPEKARSPLLSPVQANPSREPNYVNGGVYSARADVVGLGVAYTFEPAPAAWTPGSSVPVQAPKAP
jgi:long-chain fatty acid transport protein